MASRWMPHSGSSATSTSAIRWLTVGSHPGKRDAGCLADQAASAVAADEILRPQRAAVGQRDVHAGVVLREPVTSHSAMDRHRQLPDPVGQDAFDVVLPQREPVIVPGRKVADIERDPGERRAPAPPVPARETDRRCRADRALRSCAHADRPRASRRVPGWCAARRWRHRRPPAPARRPASVRSDPRRRSPPHVWSSAAPIPSVALGSAGVLRDDRGLEASPLRATYQSGEIGILLSGYFRGSAENCGNGFAMSPSVAPQEQAAGRAQSILDPYQCDFASFA